MTKLLSSAVVLGGLGQVGDLIARPLTQMGTDVILVDLLGRPEAIPVDHYIQVDITRPDSSLLNAIARADCVIMSLPERAALEASVAILDAMAEGALWVDTLSVKQDICRILNAYTGRREMVSVNPMFAPSVGLAGQAIAFIEISGGPRSELLLEKLRSLGASIEMMTAESHDQLTGAIQVATHAAALLFGAVLLELGYDVDKALIIATPPHLLMLSLLNRFVTANPEIYWEIQHYHPQAASVRRGLSRALEALEVAASADSPAGFQTLFQRIRLLLISKQEMLTKMSKGIVSATTRRDA